MSWKLALSKRNKRLARQSSSAGTSAGVAADLAKEILASLFTQSSRGGTTSAPKNAGSARAEYVCVTCGISNWCDRPACRACKTRRPQGRQPAGEGPPRRAPGPGTRPGAAAAAVTISPGKRAEELKQAARQAVRAGATAESVQPIIEQERQFRVLQAAAKSSKPLDLAREAVE